MKYKALVDIGDFKVGEEVPEERAIVWMNMYVVSPVEAIEEEPVVQKKRRTVKKSKKN